MRSVGPATTIRRPRSRISAFNSSMAFTSGRGSTTTPSIFCSAAMPPTTTRRIVRFSTHSRPSTDAGSWMMEPAAGNSPFLPTGGCPGSVGSRRQRGPCGAVCWPMPQKPPATKNWRRISRALATAPRSSILLWPRNSPGRRSQSPTGSPSNPWVSARGKGPASSCSSNSRPSVSRRLISTKTLSKPGTTLET